jgi:hypothetical protein
MSKDIIFSKVKGINETKRINVYLIYILYTNTENYIEFLN